MRESDRGVNGYSGVCGGQATGAVHEIHQERPPAYIPEQPRSYICGPSPGTKFVTRRGCVEVSHLLAITSLGVRLTSYNHVGDGQPVWA